MVQFTNFVSLKNMRENIVFAGFLIITNTQNILIQFLRFI